MPTFSQDAIDSYSRKRAQIARGGAAAALGPLGGRLGGAAAAGAAGAGAVRSPGLGQLLSNGQAPQADMLRYPAALPSVQNDIGRPAQGASLAASLAGPAGPTAGGTAGSAKPSLSQALTPGQALGMTNQLAPSAPPPAAPPVSPQELDARIYGPGKTFPHPTPLARQTPPGAASPTPPISPGWSPPATASASPVTRAQPQGQWGPLRQEPSTYSYSLPASQIGSPNPQGGQSRTMLNFSMPFTPANTPAQAPEAASPLARALGPRPRISNPVNVPRDQASYNAAINAHPRVAGLNKTLESFQQLNAEARERAAAGQRSPPGTPVSAFNPRAGLGRLGGPLATGQAPAAPQGPAVSSITESLLANRDGRHFGGLVPGKDASGRVAFMDRNEPLKPASGMAPDRAAELQVQKNPGLHATPSTRGLMATDSLRESLMARGLIEDQGARDARVAANRAGYQSRIAKSLGDRKEAVQTAAIQRNEDREGRMRTPFQNAMLAARDARNDAMGLERDRMSAQERIAAGEQQGLNTRSTAEITGRKDVAQIAATAEENKAKYLGQLQSEQQKFIAAEGAKDREAARASQERIATLNAQIASEDRKSKEAQAEMDREVKRYEIGTAGAIDGVTPEQDARLRGQTPQTGGGGFASLPKDEQATVLSLEPEQIVNYGRDHDWTPQQIDEALRRAQPGVSGVSMSKPSGPSIWDPLNGPRGQNPAIDLALDAALPPPMLQDLLMGGGERKGKKQRYVGPGGVVGGGVGSLLRALTAK
jgi:hypothetical protein